MLINKEDFTVKQTQDTLYISPGKVLNPAIKIPEAKFDKNNITHAAIKWKLPKEWRLLSAKDSVILKKESQVIVYHIFVPSGTLAKSYNLSCKVSIGKNYKTHKIKCIVQAVNKVNLIFSSPPKFQHEKDTSVVELRVENAGNIKRDIEVNTDIDGKKSTNIVSLKALSSTTIPIQIYTNKTLNYLHKYQLYANAQVKGESAAKTYAHAYTLIIPKQEKSYDQMLRIPSFVGVSYFRHRREQETKDMLQFEAFGKGCINEKQSQELEYRLKGPGAEHISSLAGYDEYYIKYSSPVLEAIAGDYNYHLSKLTEQSRYGRGLYANAKIDRWQTGAFYLQPRFYPSLKHEWATFVAYRAGKQSKIKANLLQKTFLEKEHPVYLGSIETHLQALKKTRLEAEFAWSNSKNSSIGNSMRFDLYSQYFKKLNFSAFFVRASKDFLGYYNNSLFYGTNLNYQISKKLNTVLSLNKTKYNMALDTLFVSAPERQNISAGLQYQFNPKHSILLRQGYYTSKDRLEQVRFNYDEYFVSLQYHYKTKSFSSYSEAKLSQVQNHRYNNTEKARKTAYYLSSNINYKYTDKISVGAFASLSHHNRYQNSASTYFYYGGSFQAAFSPTTFASISVQNSFSVEDDYLDRSYFQADLKHFFNKHHQLIFRSRYVLPRQEIKTAEWEVGIQYRYHFGLPVRKKAEQLCQLSGRISCKDDSSNVKCADILLHIAGKSTYTDENGFYTFKNLKQGEHYLFIDQSCLGVNTIPDKAEPMKIILSPNEEKIYNIQLQEAASIKGKIFENKASANFKVEGKSSVALSAIKSKQTLLPQLIVELSNNEDVYRIMSEADGSFEFKRLSPGDWKLKIYDNALPKVLRMQKNTWQLHLNADETKELDIPLNYKKTKIRYKKTSTKRVSLER